jgi:hypothetical protein
MTLAGVAWTASGPLRPGWNAAANNGHGSGARVALAQGSTPSTTGVAALPRSFTATLTGSATQAGAGPSGGFGQDTVQVDGSLSGGMDGTLQITLQGRPSAGGGLAVDASTVTLTPSGGGEACQGQVTSINGDHIGASCAGAQGDMIGLDIQLQVDNGGIVTGTVQGSRA